MNNFLEGLQYLGPKGILVVVSFFTAFGVMQLYHWRYTSLASKIYSYLHLHYREVLQKYGTSERDFPLTDWAKPSMFYRTGGTISLTRSGIITQFKTIKALRKQVPENSEIQTLLTQARKTLLISIVSVLLGAIIVSISIVYLPKPY